MPTSQNGYSANNVALTDVQLIPGTTRKIRLRKGTTGWMLRDLASRFDKQVETIDNDKQMDDWGYAERPIRGSSTTLSNHASGTAIDLNATQHPLGTNPSANYTTAQINAIHALLKRYQGCIRWGGDYTGRKDGMHFEIVKPQATVDAVYRQLTAPAEVPDSAPNLTIGEICLRYAREGRPMRTSDSCFADARQFLAWGRRLGAVPENSEAYWVAYHGGPTPEGGPTSGEVFTQCIKWVQAHFHLAPDGVAGPVTLSKMKPYGYIPIAADGSRI